MLVRRAHGGEMRQRTQPLLAELHQHPPDPEAHHGDEGIYKGFRVQLVYLFNVVRPRSPDNEGAGIPSIINAVECITPDSGFGAEFLYRSCRERESAADEREFSG